MKSMVVGPIVRWLIDMFMRNLEVVVESMAKEIREMRQSGKIQEYLDMIENPMVKITAGALLQALEAYLDSLNIEEIVDFT